MMNMSSVKEKLTSSGQGGDAKKSTNSVEPLNSPKKSAEANMTVPTDALDAERGLGSARQQHQDDGQGNQMQPEEPFSVFTKAQRRFVIFTAALTTLLPPLTASIYYPVITMLARDLNVSLTDINLTITTYLVCYPSPGHDLKNKFNPLLIRFDTFDR